MKKSETLIKFAREISWGDKTTYFYPPWRYLSSLENISIETFADFEELSTENNTINLYLHFPLCESKCPFCSYLTYNKKDEIKTVFIEEYEKLLLKEIELWLGKLRKIKSVKINSIYIGGGSPSYWFNSSDFNLFFDKLENVISSVSKDSFNEITFEVYPKIENFNLLNNLKQRLDNKLKISLGVQSFSLEGIKTIRNLNENNFNDYISSSLKIIKWALDNHISINLDFMWGLKARTLFDEIECIKNKLGDLKNHVNQYTFYHIWRPYGFKREQIYRDSIEMDFDKILSQRKHLFHTLKDWGFLPNIYIEYFAKNTFIQNKYNQDQMLDKDYLACGVNAHGKIGELVYLNKSSFDEYKKYLDNTKFPISKFYFNLAKENKKRKLLLSLRQPNKIFSRDELKIILNIDNYLIENFFEEDNKNPNNLKLNENGILNLTEIMSIFALYDLSLKKDWQIKEQHEIIRDIENSLNFKYFSESSLEDVINMAVFDYYKLFNCMTKFKIEVLNISYFSYLLNAPIFGFPQGKLNVGSWKNEYNIWKNDPKKISLYEIFFQYIQDVGIPYPQRFEKSEVLDKNKFFKRLVKITSTPIQDARIDSINDNRFSNLWELFKLFLGDQCQCNFIYFIGVKTSNYSNSTGGIIISSLDKLHNEDISLLGNTIVSFFSVLNRCEHLRKIHENSIKSARSAIMSRNLSHNIGSHVLSNISILNDIKEREFDISKFNNYLQQRMDFMARISTEWPDTGEYLFFFVDLIRGFLKQSLLLDKIINDDGIDGSKISFIISINGIPIKFMRNKIFHENKNSENSWEAIGNSIQNDVLIHLPGGMLGAQAFYIIIENMMRNSAKYNKKLGEYIVQIEAITKDEFFFEIRIFDNFSKNCGGYKLENAIEGTLVTLLKEKLKDELIDITGKITQKYWGIHEMKIAAHFLNNSVEENTGTSKNNFEKKYIDVKEYDGFASYIFTLPKAKLILCIDYPTQPKPINENEANHRGVFFTELQKAVDTIKRFNPELLYIEIEDEEKFKLFLGLIDKHRNILPTRIVVSIDNSKIIALSKLYEDFGKVTGLPPKRIVICPSDQITRNNDWEKFIISVFKQWIFRWQKEKLMTGDTPKCIGMVIYFERHSYLFSNWDKVKKDLLYFGVENIRFCFCSLNNHTEDFSDFSKDNYSEKNEILMVFDNHGNMEKIFKNRDFYQVIGHDVALQMNNHTIFDSLINIPSGFGGVLYVLSLIESAFTKVAIADERAANATFEKSNGLYTFRDLFNRQINIIDSNVVISASIFINNIRHKLIDKKDSDFNLKGESLETKEGISISGNQFFTLKEDQSKNVLAEIKTHQIDILVFHLSFLEEVFEKNVPAIEAWLKDLNKIVPKIVLISGRGFKPEDMPNHLPFKEASLISNHLISDFSKPHMVKCLISAQGK